MLVNVRGEFSLPRVGACPQRVAPWKDDAENHPAISTLCESARDQTLDIIPLANSHDSRIWTNSFEAFSKQAVGPLRSDMEVTSQIVLEASDLNDQSVLRIPLVDLSTKLAGDGCSVAWPKPSDVLDVGHVSRQPQVLFRNRCVRGIQVVALELLSDVEDAVYGRARHCQWPHNQLHKQDITPSCSQTLFMSATMAFCRRE